MANLKAIRDRIQSVKIENYRSHALGGGCQGASRSTTSYATRPFADRLAQVLYGLQTRLRFEAVDLLLKKREIRSVGLLVVSGDRGLCGSYNTNIIRRAESRANELKAEVGLQVCASGAQSLILAATD